MVKAIFYMCCSLAPVELMLSTYGAVGKHQ